jgi:hemoglobin/transferrin/lactoferrin receptor protein
MSCFLPISVPAEAPTRARAASILAFFLLLSSPLLAAAPPGDPAAPPADAPPETRITDEITVTATRTPRAVKDTPGEVSVIPDTEIDHQLMTDASDLVKFEPGVYVDEDLTRLGLGGFNIRGIGGNRVLTRVDGVPAGERFDFGPLAVPQYTLDLDALKSVEIVRSAGSALYGSDALGGVVSLITKDPADYLVPGVPSRVEGKAGYSSRNQGAFEDVAGAVGRERWQASLFVSRLDGRELDNRGTVRTHDATRTAPNPQDADATHAIGKLVLSPTDSSSLKLTGEIYRAGIDTQVYTSQGVTVSSRSVTNESNFDADDDKRRDRVSLEQLVQGEGPLFDSLEWRLYLQKNDSEQHTLEDIATTTTATGATTRIARRGLLTFEQDGVGGELQLQKAVHAGGEHLFTYGLAYSRDRFDQLRDRRDRNVDTGQDDVYPGPLVYPTKYFPKSEVGELGAYVQDELSLAGGRVKLVPGLRYDRYTLDPDEHDAIYLSGNEGIPAPASLDDSTVSPRLGLVVQATESLSAFGQYARGFRAPAFSEVNNGFTNFASGYTTLPNPDLKPETSDNVELGIRGSWRRGSLSLAAFRNRYDDFIETVVAGFTDEGLLEFQPQNVDHATIQGIELRGDARIGEAWTLRGSAARIRGTNDTLHQPLNSIAPASAVLGLGYARPSGKWGGELSATLTQGKGKDDVDATTVAQYAPSGYEVVDLTLFWDVTANLSLRLGAFNLLDQKYWAWQDVIGLAGDSPVLDRYTRPGRNFAAFVRVRR